MSFTDELTSFIGKEEGFLAKAYLDPRGNLDNLYSVGYGHQITTNEINQKFITLADNSKVTVVGVGGGQTTITQQQADSLLQRDLQKFVTATVNIIPSNIWSKLTDKQKVALVSYCYNTGPGSVQQGTGLAGFYSSNSNGFKEAMESSNYELAGSILRDRGVRTAKENGIRKVLQALVNRRKREGELLAGKTLPDSTVTDIDAIATPPSSFDSYFNDNYITPIRTAGFGLVADRISIKELKTTIIPENNSRPIQEVVQLTSLTDSRQLEGELSLIRGAGEINAQFQSETKSILSRVDGFLPAEAAFLVQYDLFELYPDLMRQQMSANAGESNSAVDYSHAWRAPGKLAITADITIPGVAGFTMGQIFWVGRTYEHYKQFGAFQLFGLTEVIDISKGWTTEIHSRFNALPTFKLVGLQSE